MLRRSCFLASLSRDRPPSCGIGSGFFVVFVVVLDLVEVLFPFFGAFLVLAFGFPQGACELGDLGCAEKKHDDGSYDKELRGTDAADEKPWEHTAFMFGSRT